jgi:chaperonin GroES
MAVERNPLEQMQSIMQQATNVVPMAGQADLQVTETSGPTFEVEDDGGVTINFAEETVAVDFDENNFDGEENWYENIAERLDEELLVEISSDVIERYQTDKDSREEWESMFERGFDLLGLKLETTSEPFEGACTAVHPLLIESAVKFQSKASQELFPPGGPVKAQIMGDETVAKIQQANRVENFMNYQVTEQMPEYFDEFERMLFHLPLIGSAFKKVYYDASMKRPCSEFVPIDQFYVSYYASNLQRADRYTHVIYRNPVDMAKEIASDMYRDIDLPEPSIPIMSPITSKMDQILGLNPSGDNDPQYTILEQHCYLELPKPFGQEDGVSLPYIVSVEETSRQILSIRRNYRPDDPTKSKTLHFVHYRFVPGFGFYGLGLIHFLGNLTMTATAAMRALVDAGQFANLPGGFKAKGVRIVGDNDPISPGEFKEVEATGMDLNKAIVNLPYKEPSATLYKMLEFVAITGQKFADNTEKIVSDASSYGPVGTTMALLEASSKFFSAVHKRLHKSQRDEFKILARIDMDFLPQEYPYDMPSVSRSIFKSDFDGKIDIIPVSDPNIPSNAHRMMLAQMTLQLAQNSPPGMFNLEALNRTILESANLPNIDQILPAKKVAKPQDPVSDILAATKGIPIGAFPGQDHDAHIQVKMAYLQDPMNGSNPLMKRIAPIIQANIQEHSVLKYQEQISGVANELIKRVPPETAGQGNIVEMAQAKAAQHVLQANKAAAGKQMSPEQQMVQLEQSRVALEQQKLQLKAATDSADAALENRKLDLEEAEMQVKYSQSMGKEQLKIEKDERDRISRQSMKAIDILTKVASDQAKLETSERLKILDVVTKLAGMVNSDNRDTELKGMEMLMELAKMAESKENLPDKMEEIMSTKEINL